MNSSYDSYLKAQREYDNQLPDDMEDLELESRRVAREEFMADKYEAENEERRCNKDAKE
jgi:hypothetical protein